MKSDLAEQLKEILDNMSQEEFDREWSKIAALELGVEGIGDENEEKNIQKSFFFQKFVVPLLRSSALLHQFTNKQFDMKEFEMPLAYELGRNGLGPLLQGNAAKNLIGQTPEHLSYILHICYDKDDAEGFICAYNCLNENCED